MIALNFGTVAGLTGPEQKALDELVRVYSLHQAGKVYGIKVSKPQTLYIKRVEAAVG